jgi:hypothetical protein
MRTCLSSVARRSQTCDVSTIPSRESLCGTTPSPDRDGPPTHSERGATWTSNSR